MAKAGLDHMIVCLFVCLFATISKCHKAMVADCVLVVKAISKTTFPDRNRLDRNRLDQIGRDKERNKLPFQSFAELTTGSCSLSSFVLHLKS